MNNPYAGRWHDMSYKEDYFEAEAIKSEAAEAEAMDTEICGNCGSIAYYRPGVGAHQCPDCGALLIFRRTPDGFIEEWS